MNILRQTFLMKKFKGILPSYVYGDSTCGQRAIYELGPTGIPIYNV
jgi:hypothetical protein